MMSVSISISGDLAAQIDKVASDRTKFVEQAVRKSLGHTAVSRSGELARINEVADELNEEAADVLDFQVVR